jgi:hypothetical protein
MLPGPEKTATITRTRVTHLHTPSIEGSAIPYARLDNLVRLAKPAKTPPLLRHLALIAASRSTMMIPFLSFIVVHQRCLGFIGLPSPSASFTFCPGSFASARPVVQRVEGFYRHFTITSPPSTPPSRRRNRATSR